MTIFTDQDRNYYLTLGSLKPKEKVKKVRKDYDLFITTN